MCHPGKGPLSTQEAYRGGASEICSVGSVSCHRALHWLHRLATHGSLLRACRLPEAKVLLCGPHGNQFAMRDARGWEAGQTSVASGSRSG